MSSILCTCGDYSDEALEYIGKWWLERKSIEKDPVDHDALPSIESGTSSTPPDEAQVQTWEWTMMIVQNHEFLVTGEYKAIKLRIHTCEEDHEEEEEGEENNNPGCIACKTIDNGLTISPQSLQRDEDYKAEIVKLYHTLYPTDGRRLDAQILYHDARIYIGFFLKQHDALLQVFADLSVIDSFAERLEENNCLRRVDHVELDEVFWDVDTKNYLIGHRTGTEKVSRFHKTQGGLQSLYKLQTLTINRGAFNKEVEGRDLYQDDELINTSKKQEQLRGAFKEYFQHKYKNYAGLRVPKISFRNPLVKIKGRNGGSSEDFAEMTGADTGDKALIVQ